MPTHEGAKRGTASHVPPLSRDEKGGGVSRHEALERRADRAPTPSPRRVGEGMPLPAKAAARPNRTGLPDKLKEGVEALSGLSLDDVKVRYNSPKPAQLQALAYASGTEIHVAAGQEKHLAHEAWHVVQQKQGRVRPTRTLGKVMINDADPLELEATVMGRQALAGPASGRAVAPPQDAPESSRVFQLVASVDLPIASKKWSDFTNHTKEVSAEMDLMIRTTEKRSKGSSSAQAQADIEAAGLKMKAQDLAAQAYGHFREIEILNTLSKRGFAYLGSDTDLHPDVSAIGQDGRTAIEVKAVSSPNDARVGAVLTDVLQQMSKRNKDASGDSYDHRRGEIYILNEENPWPWTAASAPAKATVEELETQAKSKYGKRQDIGKNSEVKIKSSRYDITMGWEGQS